MPTGETGADFISEAINKGRHAGEIEGAFDTAPHEKLLETLGPLPAENRACVSYAGGCQTDATVCGRRPRLGNFFNTPVSFISLPLAAPRQPASGMARKQAEGVE